MLELDDGYREPPQYSRYLDTGVAERWWVTSTLRWAAGNVDYVTSDQLAGAMSSAFDRNGWDQPPMSLLDVGRRWAMVADGSVQSTFVFPWASFLMANRQHSTIRKRRREFSRAWSPMANWRWPPVEPVPYGWNSSWWELFRHAFRGVLIGEQPQWLDSSVARAGEEVLDSLDQRDSEVIRLRFGLLDDGRKRTLEEIGKAFDVTRERIRQIEVRVLGKLRHPERISHFQLGLAADFVRSGGSLLLPDLSSMPWYRLLCLVADLKLNHVEDLETSIVTAHDISSYSAYLQDDDNHRQQRPPALLPFLSQPDADRLHQSEQEHWNRRAQSWTRPRKLREALRSLGRAAHYEEISEECAKLFPDSRSTPRSWHAALTEPSSEDFGIVWIGRKGMYGLKEHGYSRPDKDLFESVATIVASVYSETGQPVPENVVMTELNKQRRELHPASVKMALGINEKVRAIAPGVYMPTTPTSGQIGDSSRPRYDIDAAFRAFSSEDID